MRFLPVFLDLQRGVVMLVGSGELVRAKLRLLASAGARIRWYATEGNHDLAGLGVDETSRIELAAGDPLTAELSGVIAVLCAGAGDLGPAGTHCVLQAYLGQEREGRSPFNESPAIHREASLVLAG